VAAKAPKTRARNSRQAGGGPAGAARSTTRRGRSARAAEQRVSHALNHPVRLDALSYLIERVASPTEIARLTGVAVGTASFHFKELLNAGAIELVRTEQRRGALEHFYRAVERPEISDREWQALPVASRREIAATYLLAISGEALSSLRHGRMEADDDLYLVWEPVRCSSEGQAELHEMFAEFHERLEELKARDEARQDGDTRVRMIAMLNFERCRDGRPQGTALRRPGSG
jgi:DNA-binding transcriptional ArsR family regulator